jgi:type IV secretory pathway VirB10-like protein
MPRPKVRPEDRQRAVKACLPCKASKKRCDAQQPCSNCVRKKSASTCEYAESPVRPRGVHAHATATTSAQPPPSLEQEHEHAIGVSDDEEDENENEDAIRAMPTTLGKRSRSPAAAAAQSSNPRRRLSGGGRLLLNSKGEKGKT